jgi:hypothetical protein
MDVAVEFFCGIDYHLRVLLLSPGALHGNVYICKKFKVKTSLAVPTLQ